MVLDKSDTLARICNALTSEKRDEAIQIARQEYPFDGRASRRRQFSEVEYMRVFKRDGFIDRYSGQRLVFPGTLRLLSKLMPEEFPAHPNWKMSESHMVYWEFFPTIDHVHPITRGGMDREDNWVTTSMTRNSAKSNWTLEELGWSLKSPGDILEWDGLTKWFLAYTEKFSNIPLDGYILRWRRAAQQVFK